jgi:hypothetical protein
MLRLNSVGAMTAQNITTKATSGSLSTMSKAPCSKSVCSVTPNKCTEIKGRENAGKQNNSAVTERANILFTFIGPAL